MDVEAVLGFLDEPARLRAYEQCFFKLESTPRLDLEALSVCIRLRPSLENAEKLSTSLLLRIPQEHEDHERIYKLAEILLSNGQFGYALLGERIRAELVALLPELSKNIHGNGEPGDEAERFHLDSVRKATAFLDLLKCVYWLPNHHNHIIDPTTLEFLSRFIGVEAVDNAAHDTVSAFLSLLKRGGTIVVAHATSAPQPWARYDSSLGQMVLVASVIDESVWHQFSALGPGYFKTGGSKVFRTWFQWSSQVVADGTRLRCLKEDLYWQTLRTGLLKGYSDQRKYCLGIVRQSLLAAHGDISTPTMRFAVADSAKYLKIYEQFSSLFETIVLDRYSNQVQACLPELTRLFATDITPVMATTLLSAALHPTLQESVRKIIGNWYMGYLIQAKGNCEGHLSFLMEGFLPWATLGELFTSTIVSTRAATRSLHGVALADVVVTFVVRTPDSPSVLVPTRRAVIHGVLEFILNTKGRIFQFAILYLLRGLTKGLMALAVPLQEPFTQAELGQVLQVSRIAGLPEIANDLCLEYCLQICQLVTPHWHDYDWTGLADLRARGTRLLAPLEQLSGQTMDETSVTNSSPLKVLLAQLDASNHRSIQGESYAPACKSLIEILDRTDPASVSHTDLYNLLDAFWEEADRRQFCKSVAINIPPLLFHPTCIRACVLQHCTDSGIASNVSLQSLLSKAMDQLQRLSDGRSYVLAVLAVALRRAALSDTKILNILPYDDYTLRFLNVVPSTKIEFLFEIAAAEELQQYRSHRTYEAYYGQREWHAYASVIDLIQRFPVQQLGIAKRVLNQLLEPWKEQRAGIPVISKWKNVLQLQAMLLLAEFTISESEVDSYLEAFRHALILEAWPRYRFLLEWIIARLYHKFPGKTAGLLDDLSNLDDNSSTHIASLMKLAVLIAPHETEDFSTKFMTQLVPFSASPKVHIRHESNYAIPIIIDLALSKGWTSITENKAFIALNAFIRGLDKFQSVPWTIRTLKLDAVKDFHLVNIFQGQYLTIESPEKIRVTYEDFLALQHADKTSGLVAPPSRISIGTRLEPAPPVPSPLTSPPHKPVDSHPNPTPSFFQTKSSFDPLSLLAASGPPSTQSHRPASIILVASLIDNPTNLGGLSRISESFGIEALYIDDVRKTAHKDFKATSVTSEKHFPIRELKVEDVPGFLNSVKGEGWQVVGIEQTDRSGVLGTEDGIDIGTLPRKCVLVLGSEKGGISAEVLAVVDRCVEIRTVGVTRSLNVQTAGGIAVYEWWREWGGK